MSNNFMESFSGVQCKFEDRLTEESGLVCIGGGIGWTAHRDQGESKYAEGIAGSIESIRIVRFIGRFIGTRATV